MSFDPLTAAFDFGKIAIEKLFPDKTKRAEEMRKLEEMRQNGDLAKMEGYNSILMSQINVNAISAKHPSLFVSGARPAAIWAGVFALVWSGIIHPMLLWAWAFGQAMDWIPKELSTPPLIETGALITIVGSLLGVSGLRSYEKKEGVHKDSL
jgi:hypothetical protein